MLLDSRIHSTRSTSFKISPYVEVSLTWISSTNCCQVGGARTVSQHTSRTPSSHFGNILEQYSLT
ncbi:hypothetical protein FOXYSP1_06646 [Fusarium oxysporum f. sp. phaseoli]